MDTDHSARAVSMDTGIYILRESGQAGSNTGVRASGVDPQGVCQRERREREKEREREREREREGEREGARE